LKLRIENVGQVPAALFAIAMAALVAADLSPAQAANPAEADRVKRGEMLTDAWCSSCHVTGAGSQRSAADIAPPFYAIANNKAISNARIRGVLTKPHGRMPTDALTRRQIEDVVSYILSLRRTQR
jgi:mono/diheme cytochrome c family protein